ncbi:MAG: phosphoglycerate dehydrogenase [Eggerthellaceae bacterium]|jgi:D-3-phosphoglycerate dehydrogenase
MRYVHCLNNISKKGTDTLPDNYELTDDINQADGIMVRSAAMHDMEFSDNLLAIARAGAGVNNIPLDRCAEEGIVVFNTPGANANAVKELVIAGLLLASRDIIGGIEWCKENADDENIAKTREKAKKAFAGNELKGKKLGVIGLGAIGALVSNAAIALGMDVYGYDPFLSVNAAWRIDNAVTHVTDVNDIYKNADYITIHVPATADTKGMINADAIAQMKEGVNFLNFARDTLVDNDAMAAGLESGKVAHYVTDFAIPAAMKMKNAIVLPHLGASTEEAEDNCAIMAAKELTDYIENGIIVNSVNYPVNNMGGIRAGIARVCVLHKNVPAILSKITAILGDANVNIANMANNGKGDNAYTLIDVEADVDDAAVEKIAAIEGVRRVRVIK